MNLLCLLFIGIFSTGYVKCSVIYSTKGQKLYYNSCFCGDSTSRAENGFYNNKDSTTPKRPTKTDIVIKPYQFQVGTIIRPTRRPTQQPTRRPIWRPTRRPTRYESSYGNSG